MRRKQLFELVNLVCDEKSFLQFINELMIDKIKDNDSLGNDEWVNASIETFLESAYSWGQISVNGLEFYEKPENPWKRCAQILYMGKIYE